MFRKKKQPVKYKVIEHKPVDLRLQVETTSFKQELSSWSETDKLVLLPPHDLFAHISKRNGLVTIYNNIEKLELKHPGVEGCHSYKDFFITCSLEFVCFWKDGKQIAKIPLELSLSHQDPYVLKTAIVEKNKLYCWVAETRKPNVIDLELLQSDSFRYMSTPTHEIIPLSDGVSCFAAVGKTKDAKNIVCVHRPNSIRTHDLGEMTDTAISPSTHFWADYSTHKPGVKVWKVIDNEVRIPLQTFPEAENPYWHLGKLIFRQKQMLYAFDPETLALDQVVEIPKDAIMLNGSHSLFQITRQGTTLTAERITLKLAPTNEAMCDRNAEKVLNEVLPLPQPLQELVMNYYCDPTFFAAQQQKAQLRMLPSPISKMEEFQSLSIDFYNISSFTMISNQSMLVHHGDRNELFGIDEECRRITTHCDGFFVALDHERYAHVTNRFLNIHSNKTGKCLKSKTWNFQYGFELKKVIAAHDGKYLLIHFNLYNILVDAPPNKYVMVMDTETSKSICIPTNSVDYLTMANEKVLVLVSVEGIQLVNINLDKLKYAMTEISMPEKITQLFVRQNKWIICTEDPANSDYEYVSLWHANEESTFQEMNKNPGHWEDNQPKLSYQLTFMQDLGKTNCGCKVQNNSVFFGYHQNEKMLVTAFDLEAMTTQQHYVPSVKRCPITLFPDNRLVLWANGSNMLRIFPAHLEVKQEHRLAKPKR